MPASGHLMAPEDVRDKKVSPEGQVERQDVAVGDISFLLAPWLQHTAEPNPAAASLLSPVWLQPWLLEPFVFL